MARKYTKRRKGGNSNEILTSDFQELENIVKKINNDVKELKDQLSKEETNETVDEKESSDEKMGSEPSLEEEEDSNQVTEIEETEKSEEKTLDEKKEEINNLIETANTLLYKGSNCDFKMSKKPCSTGKDALDGFERSMNKPDFDDKKADALKLNIQNYISKIKSDLNIKGGRRRKSRKHKNIKSKYTKKRKYSRK